MHPNWTRIHKFSHHSSSTNRFSKQSSSFSIIEALLHATASADRRPLAPAAGVEGVPQLRCVGSGRGALTARVSLLARCDLTAVSACRDQ